MLYLVKNLLIKSLSDTILAFYRYVRQSTLCFIFNKVFKMMQSCKYTIKENNYSV